MRLSLLLATVLPLAAADFTAHTVATGLRGGYQVVVADLNHDGKPDLIALASGMPELVWFENPTWERHVIAGGLRQMINCAVVGDEIVLASEFSNQAKDSAGVVSVLRPNGDPRQPWSVTEIDRMPTSHRLRVAKIDGGKPIVVNAALTGPKAEPPDYRGQTPLVYYRAGEWKRHVISEENSGVVHGVWIIDWDGDAGPGRPGASGAGGDRPRVRPPRDRAHPRLVGARHRPRAPGGRVRHGDRSPRRPRGRRRRSPQMIAVEAGSLRS